jgi:4,5-dihydroxyphthalate decarboxylase
MSMNERALSIGCLFSDRVEALADGRVRIDGYETSIAFVEAQRLFRLVLREAAYDVAELSMASHIASIARGRRDYCGVPVFPSRSFRHSNLYVRTDRGIGEPRDLVGRTIGVIDFQQTAALWVRGILAEEHGVRRQDVRWVAAGLHDPVLEDRAPTSVAPGIRLERSASTLDALLRTGEIDAVISPTAPRCIGEPGVEAARMWSDAPAEELGWWRRTGIFPIMHVLVVRRSLVEADAALPTALFNAFEEARRLAAADVRRRDFAKVALPWLPGHAALTDALLERDPWTYGVDTNRSALDAMLRYAVADGMAGEDVTVERLFS